MSEQIVPEQQLDQSESSQFTEGLEAFFYRAQRSLIPMEFPQAYGALRQQTRQFRGPGLTAYLAEELLGRSFGVEYYDRYGLDYANAVARAKLVAAIQGGLMFGDEARAQEDFTGDYKGMKMSWNEMQIFDTMAQSKGEADDVPTIFVPGKRIDALVNSPYARSSVINLMIESHFTVPFNRATIIRTARLGDTLG